jgi:TrmH family RNA methyltransferase
MEDRIASTKNETVKRFKRAALKKFRREESLFLLEGPKMAEEALKGRKQIEIALFDEENPPKEPLLSRLSQHGARVIPATKAVLDAVSDAKEPQNIAALCRMEKKFFSMEAVFDKGFYLFLENLQDPGNIGAILRSANAFFVSGVILSPGCADIFSPKVLRAAAGAVFSLPVYEDVDRGEAIKAFRKKGYRVLGSGVSERTSALAEIHAAESTLLLIGNEGRGLAKETLELCDEIVKIPMRENAESLNAAVAAGILLWELSLKKRGLET